MKYLKNILKTIKKFILTSIIGEINILLRRLVFMMRIRVYGILAQPYDGKRALPVPLAEYCVGCQACSRFCPTSAIVLKDEVGKRRRSIVWNYEKCISCGLCERLCPQPKSGVMLSASYDVAANSVQQMKVDLEFKLVVCELCAAPIATEDQLAYLRDHELPESVYANPLLIYNRFSVMHGFSFKKKKKNIKSREDLLGHTCSVCRAKINKDILKVKEDL